MQVRMARLVVNRLLDDWDSQTKVLKPRITRMDTEVIGERRIYFELSPVIN